MTTFKEIVDQQLAEKVAKVQEMQKQLPWFFRMKAYDPEKAAAFKTLPKQPTAKEYHDTIAWIQLCLKDTRIDAKEFMEASKELLEFIPEAFNLLVEAYEIQGRILVKIAENQGLDLDSLIADLMLERNPHGQRAAQYVADNVSVTIEPEENKEDNSYSLPF